MLCQFLPVLLDILFAGIREHRNIIDLHIDAVFGISVLDKDQIMGCHPCLQFKMSPVIIPCRIVVPDAVKSILQGMIGNSVRTQIITYGIRITEYINLLISLEIHRDVRLQQLSEFSGKADPLQHV